MKIGNHNWKILIVSREEINGDDGQCIPTLLTIKLADDFSGEYRKIAFTHELIHAIFDEQGRYYEKEISHEDLCEFVAWNYDEIERCVNEFVEEIGL